MVKAKKKKKKVIQEAAVLFCSNAGENGKELPSHITNSCFSKILRAVLKGGQQSRVPNIWGFTAT